MNDMNVSTESREGMSDREFNDAVKAIFLAIGEVTGEVDLATKNAIVGRVKRLSPTRKGRLTPSQVFAGMTGPLEAERRGRTRQRVAEALGIAISRNHQHTVGPEARDAIDRAFWAMADARFRAEYALLA